jgi:hypothetical protein
VKQARNPISTLLELISTKQKRPNNDLFFFVVKIQV